MRAKFNALLVVVLMYPIPCTGQDQSKTSGQYVVKKRAFLEGHTNVYVRDVVFSPDGRLLASASDDTTVRLWDVATGKQKAILEHARRPHRVAFSPDGKTLATGSRDTTGTTPEGYPYVYVQGELLLWDLASGKRKATLKGHAAHVDSLAFPPDGKILAAASTGIVGKGAEDEARVLKLWDVESGRELAHLGEGHGQVAFFPDGKTLVSETPDSVTFWSLATCKPLRTIKCGSIDCLALSPNGRILAVGTYSAWVNLYDVASGDLRKKFHSGDRDVSALASSPDGKVLAVARYVRPLQLRDATTGKVKADLEDTQFPPSVAFSPDGKILAAGGADGKVKLWDLPVEK